MGHLRPESRTSAFTELGHARYQEGRIAEATRAFDAALAAARSLDSGPIRIEQLEYVLSGRLTAGLAADAETVLTEIRNARLQTGEAFSVFIAWVQERMGRREEALATYRQALEDADAGSDELKRHLKLMELIPGFGSLPAEPRWIAETAPQVARMAHAVEDPSYRATLLVALADALPD